MMIPGPSAAQPITGLPAAPPKYSPNVPAKITTPDAVETRIGTLRFRDGAPDPATVQLAYDQLDFGRGVDAFLKGMSATSVYAACRGLEEGGLKPNEGIAITEDLIDVCGADEEIFFVGGAELYAQALPLADRLYLTEIQAEVEGDAWFPEYDRAHWREISRDRRRDEARGLDYHFVVYDRQSS